MKQIETKWRDAPDILLKIQRVLGQFVRLGCFLVGFLRILLVLLDLFLQLLGMCSRFSRDRTDLFRLLTELVRTVFSSCQRGNAIGLQQF